mgnify:CR=1 FL=1
MKQSWVICRMASDTKALGKSGCSRTLVSALLGVMVTSQVAAQSGTPVLEEVVVTAQKRAENIQDVPSSVSALSGETLKDNNIDNLNDLSLYTPNVKLQAVAPFGRIWVAK